MRGDRPSTFSTRMRSRVFTPHARGSTLLPSKGWYYMGVYPACAGIDHSSGARSQVITGLPRMRGDRPRDEKNRRCRYWFTPHARGSTSLGRRLYGRNEVYPACAGIDHNTVALRIRICRLPRMRGDRPST